MKNNSLLLLATALLTLSAIPSRAQVPQALQFNANLAQQVSADLANTRVSVNITNNTPTPLTIVWVDHQGTDQTIAGVIQGTPITFESTPGHIFKLLRPDRATDSNFRVTTAPNQFYVKNLTTTTNNNTAFGTIIQNTNNLLNQTQIQTQTGIPLAYNPAFLNLASPNLARFGGTKVVITNNTSNNLSLTYNNSQGIAQSLDTIPPGSPYTLDTSPGVIFHLLNGSTPVANLRVGNAPVQNYSVGAITTTTNTTNTNRITNPINQFNRGVPQTFVNLNTLTRITFTDPATGQVHNLTKSGHNWTGTHPAYNAYGLKMGSMVSGILTGNLLHLHTTGAGLRFWLRLDTQARSLSHASTAPTRTNTGDFQYNYQGHYYNVTFQ